MAHQWLVFLPCRLAAMRSVPGSLDTVLGPGSSTVCDSPGLPVTSSCTMDVLACMAVCLCVCMCVRVCVRTSTKGCYLASTAANKMCKHTAWKRSVTAALEMARERFCGTWGL